MKQIVNVLGKLDWRKKAAAVLLLSAVIAAASDAQTLTTLHRFDNADCASPTAALVQAIDGSLYGTTQGGGATNTGTVFVGTIFAMNLGGALTTLYSFCPEGGAMCPNGNAGSAPLIQAANGELYGTTADGDNGYGSVFEMTLIGALTTIYDFPYLAWEPEGLVQATNGNFCGATHIGGRRAPYCPLVIGCGTLFEITPGGVPTTLHGFCPEYGCADGTSPSGGLVQAANGDFYGTTEFGGANCAPYGCGTVFGITPGGALTTLYSFCSQPEADCLDGNYPEAGLTQAANGELYGTTSAGGVYGYGTIFKITTGGTLTTLYSFCAQSGCPDGEEPINSLIQATDGNLYGTTLYGGPNCSSNTCGTLFKLTPGGTLTTLYAFCAQPACADGEDPSALVQDTNGDLYGVTAYGGTGDGSLGLGCGTVFSFSVGLAPFVRMLPASATVGTAVRILGTDLTGATSVTFNGAAAAFEVISPAEIATAVPVGATSGEVQVVTPNGTLSSNVPFRVLP
jgi:uncharacterized repeat protein (TIGR03803 family)